MNKLWINLYCALIADKQKRALVRRALRHPAPRKKILVVSANFSGGGLETRINNIVNRFHDKYSFSLITKTHTADMKIKPSEHFAHVYAWDEYPDALYGVDILDIHPFGVTDIITQWRIPSQIKKIYTLHGVASLDENLDFLEYFHRIYTVAELLRPNIERDYPGLANKLCLSKNRDTILDYASVPVVGKHILFSITNTACGEFLQRIIGVIPAEYTVHIIGNFSPDAFTRQRGKIKYHGFVNIDELFAQNRFDMAFARGGFATMDIIARNIPCLCISDDESDEYFETLSRNNFAYLSMNNFVTRKKFDLQNIVDDIKRIEQTPADYRCRDLLKQYNDIDDMPDLYAGL